MAVRPIVLLGDPVLRAVAAEVTVFDDALRLLAADMFDTMYGAPGRGLAAPQVGVSQRLCIMDPGWKDGEPNPKTFVNPHIAGASALMQTRAEGCLSIPGRTCRVVRPTEVFLRWQGLWGAWHEGWFYDVEAVCVQHEIDHLNGVLCIDYLEEPA